MQILNKLLTKAIFSEATNLNVSAVDLGKDMISVRLRNEAVNRLEGATHTIASANLYVLVEIVINILKTSPVFNQYLLAIQQKAIVGGTITLYDDRGNSYMASDVSLNVSEFPNMNGTEASVNFSVLANFNVNTQLLSTDI